MLETLVITFREGLEAFLIVAIMLAYLIKTGRNNLVRPVYYGVAVALLLSATTGWHITELAENPVTEGSLALIAGAMVASLTVYVMKTAKSIRQSISDTLEKHATKTNAGAAIGIFLFTVLMIAREGMETAMMLGTISHQIDSTPMLIGALGGLATTALIGTLWVKKSSSINLRLFMQVTGIFLVLFSIHLLMYGLHELSETEAFPILDNEWLHETTEIFDSHRPFAKFVTYSLLVVPCAWLLVTYVRDKFAERHLAAK